MTTYIFPKLGKQIVYGGVTFYKSCKTTTFSLHFYNNKKMDSSTDVLLGISKNVKLL